MRAPVDAFRREGGIDAAFEPIARVGVDLEPPAGGGGDDRIPIGAFDEDLGGVLGAAGFLAAHNARDAFRPVFVGYGEHVRFKLIGAFVQCDDFGASVGPVNAQVALHLGDVENVQRTVQVVGEPVGHIHQRRDRAKADGAQAALEPVGGRAILDAPDNAAAENRRGGERVFVDGHADRTGELALDLRRDLFDQLAKPARGKIARHAPDAQRVGAVRGDGDFDHRVVEIGVVDIANAHRRVGGQVDDPVMILRDHQLAFRTEHSVRFDAPDYAGL